ncbi:MAG: bifunctional diaminohydroxyphosphoribosylaminopyrimidine deaminase/5-amino-6-(5-phosphoribosylamino)uracil reductase RibD [Eudoraea sp.]|nr:bifunctional diaminohydroxyphosphoribosylaminopyrimidine deaminase/5-amino-6-(5-phosphoribosylamino)uracil reductase RibD [Eudoraea sp.]
MARCIEIGKNAMGTAAPNPMVGAVLVHENKIIGEGYTSPYGGPHAEVNAINAVRDHSTLRKATLYVSLEPCSHHGKTPPCADLILQKKIPRVVIGLKDPHEKVAGLGIERLQKAGCEVITGILEKKCREHHRRFLTYHEKKRPYIILKWAQSTDGFLAPEQAKRKHSPQPYWISCGASRQLVHKWRGEEQAIMVGTNTVLQDNPSLTTRNWFGKNPLRVLLDRNLRVPGTFKIFEDKAMTLVITTKEAPINKISHIIYEQLPEGKFEADAILAVLWRRQVSSIIVEGGKQILELFLRAGLWDEARIFSGSIPFNAGLKAPEMGQFEGEDIEIGVDRLKVIRND